MFDNAQLSRALPGKEQQVFRWPGRPVAGIGTTWGGSSSAAWLGHVARLVVSNDDPGSGEIDLIG